MRKIIAVLLLAGFITTSLPFAVYANLPAYSGSPLANQVLRQIQFTDIGSHWAKSSIIRMAAQGIIRGVGNNKFNPEGYLTKEQAIILLLRALGEGANAEKLAETLANKQENQASNPSNYIVQGYLERAQELEIITQEQKQALQENRNQRAQRQEVAYWTAKALGLEPVYGTAQRLIYGFKDQNRFDPAFIPWIESMLQKKYMSGTSNTTFNPRGAMKRAEMAALLDRVNSVFAAKRGVELSDGYLMAKSTRWDGGAGFTVYEIKTDDGRRFELLTGGTNQADVIVYKNGKLGNATLLAVGDRVSLVIEPGPQVVYIEAKPTSDKLISGQVKNVDQDNSRLTVIDAYGRESTYAVAPGVTVLIENRPAGLKDLVIGIDVTLSLNNNVVSKITGSLGGDLGSYTPPVSGIRTGRVKEVTSKTLLLLNDNGQQEEYYLSNSTWVTKNGTWKSLNQLQVGDRVKLYLNNLASRVVDKIEISSNAGKIVRVVKGKLEQVYPGGSKLALSGVKEFFYGQWYPVQGFELVDVVADTEIYAKGQMITASQLAQNFLGQEVYLAFTQSYGNPQGVKLVVKDGVAQTYGDRIVDMDWGANQFVLDNEKLRITLNPGTIVIRGNKLVDRDDLEDKDYVFLETNGSGSNLTSVLVATADFYPKDWELYRGRIDAVEEDRFELAYYSRFEDNEWDEPSRSGRDVDLGFDAETVIFDTVLGREISPGKFAESRWSGYYEDDYYAYAVTEDDKTLAMTLWDYYDRPQVLKTTLGRVSRVSSNTVELDWVVDWSQTYEKWMNSYPLTLNLSNALIYKEEELVTVNDIKAGDYLYLIHDQYQGIIVFIQ